MKRKNWIIIGVIGILAIGGIVVFDYFSLENQVLRDIDEFYETGEDYELGVQIMNKINTMAGNEGKRYGIVTGERLDRFVQNPKVQQFLVDWTIKHSNGTNTSNT